MTDPTRPPEPPPPPPPPIRRMTRRAMIGTGARAVAAALVAVAAGRVATGGAATARASELAGEHAGRRRQDHPHPEPRPGIDASRMPSPERVREHPDAVAAFDEARQIPQILDGIRCHCGCADEPGMRSLLVCYEGDSAMALDCRICQGQARLAYRLSKRGRSLAQIREAIDARFGG